MQGWVDTEIPAIALALIIIIAVSLGFAHQVTEISHRKLKRSRRLVAEAGGTLIKAEAKLAADHTSMLDSNSTCFICQNPTTRRCSRCKSVRYCSSDCQGVHWKEGHKKECRAPEDGSVADSGATSGIMCNGQRLEKSRGLDNAKTSISSSRGSAETESNNSNTIGDDNTVQSNLLPKPPCNTVTSDGSLPKPKELLFPYDYFVQLFNWDMLGSPCGLINCGNSCFANVVLQCLTYTRPLAAYLLDGCHGEECRRVDWCFMCELQRHVWKVRNSRNPFSPIRILSRMRSIGNHLGYGSQEDAHEFMRFAIDSMQSICLDEAGGEKAVDIATQETTLVHNIFGGHLQSQVKCMKCQHESNRYESMMDLAVEIHGTVDSLEDAIAQFTTAEMLDGDNKYKCDRCNAYVKACKRLTVHEAPNILTIALKRFQSGKFGKLNKRVTFPEVLDMSPYMSGKHAYLSLYTLYAVVVHVDMLNASFFGHYICYVKDSNGVWYKIDDSKVKEVELEKVMAQKAYMLFYSRSVVRKAPMTGGQPSPAASVPRDFKTNRLPVSLETQRTSIFPPTLGAISVPTYLSRDYSTENPSLKVKMVEDENEVQEQAHMQSSDQIIEAADYRLGEASLATKESDVEMTSTCMSEGLMESPNSSDRSLSSLRTSTPPGNLTTEIASTSQISGCFSSLAGNLERGVALLESISDGPEKGGAKRIHERFLPGLRPLNTDQLVFPLEDHGRSPSPTLEFRKTFSTTSTWPKGVVDLVSSSVSSVLNSEPVVPSFPSPSIEDKWQRSEEREVWKDSPSARAKRQHIEDTSGLAGSAGPIMDENHQPMEVDEETSFVHSFMNAGRHLEVRSDDCAGSRPVSLDAQMKHEVEVLPRSSSKALLEFESLCSHSGNEQNNIKYYPFTQPSHQGCVLIEELPGPVRDCPKDAAKMSVVATGPESLKDLYDEILREDDYVVVKPLSVQRATAGYGEIPSVQQDGNEQKSEASILDLQEVRPVYNNESFEETGQEKNIVMVAAADVKPEEQSPKPLFSRGFLNKTSRPRSAKYLYKRTATNTFSSGGGGNCQAQSVKADQHRRYLYPKFADVSTDTEVDNQR